MQTQKAENAVLFQLTCLDGTIWGVEVCILLVLGFEFYPKFYNMQQPALHNLVHRYILD